MFDVSYASRKEVADSNPKRDAIWRQVTVDGEFALFSEFTSDEKREALELYDSLPEVSFKQHPDWDQMVTISGSKLYFTYRKGGALHAFATLRFPTDRVAMLEFGPVGRSKEDVSIALSRIVEAVGSETGAWYLQVQLPMQVGQGSEFVINEIGGSHSYRTFDDKRNWASSVIDTSATDEELVKRFSKNHKRSVKKASKFGLTSRVCDSEEEIKRFNDIYCAMYKVRGEKVDRDANLADYLRLLKFFRDTGNGFFYGVFDDGELIGGMIIIKQGDYGFYHHSASDPEKRKVPVLHLGVFNVLDELRARGIRYFDFGGYNHMVDKTDQVYNINRFKDGFTKDYTYYPKLMYFEFKPNAVRLLELTQSFKNLIKKIIRR